MIFENQNHIIIHHINWHDLSKCDYANILNEIPIGHCVARLPYETNEAKVQIIPPNHYTKMITENCNLKTELIDRPIIEFERKSAMIRFEKDILRRVFVFMRSK